MVTYPEDKLHFDVQTIDPFDIASEVHSEFGSCKNYLLEDPQRILLTYCLRL